MCSGPVEQLRLMMSIWSDSRMASTAATSVPRSMRPVTSSETDAMIGTGRPDSAAAARAPNTAALVSRMSCCVSMIRTSAPPSMSAAACSWNTGTRSANPSRLIDGSLDAGRNPVGPMLPATKRARPSFEYSSATLRASPAAATLSSRVSSPWPHSSRRGRVAWKEQVSMTSHPASRNPRCTRSTTCGALSARPSIQPSSAAPP